ncbi:MAG: hypothetical protein ABIP94_06180 [Planctomycetota bacterium]
MRALVRLAVGVGKSRAADALLESPLLYELFDFVLYAAPAWSILRERRIIRAAATSQVPWMLLLPRPKERCGDFAEPWSGFEARGCSTYAKATLCRQCQTIDPGPEPCQWPGQFSRIKDHRLLFCTEQQLLLNRALVPMVRGLVGAKRILVILDEARLLDANFEMVIARDDLDAFAAALQATPDVQHGDEWLHAIARIRAWRTPSALRLRLCPSLHRDAFRIQKSGIEGLGDDFRYIGYDLSMLATSQRAERWIEADKLRFIARPFLHCHVLMLSAHLSGDYAGERLGCGPLASPFENTVFRHTGSRIFNLKSSLGADKYFVGNHRQILDTAAVLIVRNIAEQRSTVLVSRKKSKTLCARYLTKRLAAWGLKVRVVSEDYTTLPDMPDPRVVPVIHYGILGVNDFEAYDSAYCVNGYYISSRELGRAAQSSTPSRDRVQISIDSKPDMIRRARVTEGPDPGGVIAHVASLYLQKLEIDPVIQAVGRVRFLTRPREVAFLQMANLEPHVGPHQVVASLAGLRAAIGIPSAREIDEGLDHARIRTLLDGGASAKEVAGQLGMSLSTVRRRLRGRVSVIPYLSTIRRESDTPPGAGGGQ